MTIVQPGLVQPGQVLRNVAERQPSRQPEPQAGLRQPEPQRPAVEDDAPEGAAVAVLGYN